MHLFSSNQNHNRVLGLDLVVRDANGNTLDPDTTGVIELYRRVCPLFLFRKNCLFNLV